NNARASTEGTTEADDTTDYVVDTDEDRVVAMKPPAPQPPQFTVSAMSPFKSARAFKPPENSRPTPQSSPTKRQPDPSDVIELSSSSESEPEPASRQVSQSPSKRASESPSLGAPQHRSHSVASSEIIVLDNPPSTQHAPSSSPSSEDDIELISFSGPTPKSRSRKPKRRILSSPDPFRHVPSELRARGFAPEFYNSPSFASTPRRPRGSEDAFFRPTGAGGTRPRPNSSPDREMGSPIRLPPSSPPLPTPTPVPAPATPTPTPALATRTPTSAPVLVEPTPAPAPAPVAPSPTPIPVELSPTPAPVEPTVIPAPAEPTPAPAEPTPPPPPAPPRVLRMECILLPKASRATLNALARFEKLHQSRARVALANDKRKEKEKAKRRASFVVEVPAPATKSKAPRRKSEGGGGLGKGKGKGGYAAREEGRWESSSPVRTDVDMDDDEPDEMDLIANRSEDEQDEVVVDGDDESEAGFSSADSESPILHVQVKTPSPRKGGRKPGRKKKGEQVEPEPEPEAEPEEGSPGPTQPPPTPKTKLALDPLVDAPSNYRRLPREIKDTTEKYCHCCRTKKQGKLKMMCSNRVARGRRKKARDEEGLKICATPWCQWCILKHGLKFDPLRDDFTCPLCDDTCVCDVCRRKRGLEPMGRWGLKKQVEGGTQEEEQQEGEEEQQEEEEDEEDADAPGQEEEHQESSALEEGEDMDVAMPSSSTGDPGAKRAGYAELMRQRGPTKWHGRHTPPPLRHRDRVGVSMNDVYIPRGPVENELEETAEPMEGAVELAERMVGSAEETFESGGLAMDMEELLLVDQLTSAEPESQAEYDDVAAMNEAILGLGPATHVDDESILAGLDANLEAARHFYGSQTAAEPGLGSHALFDAERMRRQQLRLRNAPDVMLAGSDTDQHLKGFGDTQMYSPGASQSLAPPILSRPPSVEPSLAQPGAEPEPEVESEPVPDLSTVAESAKSTDLETPSPQFGVDAGVESANLDLQDLFGGQNIGVRVGNLDDMGALLTGENTGSVEAPKSTVENPPVEAIIVDSNLTPTANATDPPVTSSTFALPTADDHAQLRTTLARHFRAQNTITPTEGRITRSRSRRSL
ncbi:hypothetical protein FRC07_006325, partial [Ceratobasidium sp. 392]